jgi:uncharacterized protein (DUF58 family)
VTVLRRSLRDLRPTRRGAAVAAIAGTAFLLGATTGARSLNAIVVPALVALSAAAAQLARTEAPTVERTVPEPGFPEEQRTVTVSVDAEVPCRVTDGVASGLVADGATAAVGHGGEFEYSVTLRERGEHDLGPASCRLTDSLGLFAVELESRTAATVLVYPDAYEIDSERLASLVRRVRSDERTSFDRLREFSRGDTMRDIHWRASAKRGTDEFVVAEYDSFAAVDAVTVIGEAALGSADAMASTVASVVTFLHDAGVPVTVVVPGGECVAHPGETTTVLRLLALTPGGYLAADRRQAADARVVGEDGRATVSLATGDVAFDGVAGDRRGPEVVG